MDTFKNIEVGQQFKSNGTTYKKVSTRTGEIIAPEEYAGATFYFSAGDLVEISNPLD
jgi:hypothetical protein